MAPKPPLPELLVKNQAAWAMWLEKNHAKSPGVLLVMTKKDSPIAAPTYPEAVEVALCYGWIDGQASSRSEGWIQRFTPRGAKSIWSRINVGKVEVLIAAGKMKPAGIAAVELAKADGRWAAAYPSPKSVTVPEDFQKALDAKPKAKAFFETLSKTNRFGMLFRITTAKKEETRTRRIKEFVAMLGRKETLY